MSVAFGTSFHILNNVYQPLTTMNLTPTGKHYVHLVTLSRGLKEYMAYLDRDTNDVWIEELDPKHPYLLKRIEDDNEWKDILMFCQEARLLRVGVDEEIALGQDGIFFA